MALEGLLVSSHYSKQKPPASALLSRGPLREGLRFCLAFNEGAGATLYDDVAEAKVALTSCIWNSRTVGSALTFNGTSSYGQTQFKPGWTNTSRFSILIWIKTTDANRGAFFADYVSAAATNVEVFTDGKARFYISTGATVKDYRGGTTINDGKWHQVVCTFGGNQNPLIYVDGKLETLTKTTDNTLAAATINSGSAYRIGRDNRAASPIWLEGDFSFCGVWSRVLSQQEIRELYQIPFALYSRISFRQERRPPDISGETTLASAAWTALTPIGTSEVTGVVGLATGGWTALAPTGTSEVIGTVGLASGSWTALTPSGSSTVTIAAALASASWIAYDATGSVAGGNQTGALGLATGGWVAFNATGAYEQDTSAFDVQAISIDPSILAFPFEIPIYSQNTLRKDRLLGGWNYSLVAWWDAVRKKLYTKIGDIDLADLSALQAQNTLLIAQVETLTARKDIVKRTYGSSNQWVYEHKRGVKPIVSAWIFYQAYSSVDFEQVESSSNNTTTLIFGANYSGEAVYAFPSL